MELNKQDGGNRRFILCNNDEGSNADNKKNKNICRDICQPRIKKIMTGYQNNKKEVIEGLGSNLHYFKINNAIKPDVIDKRRIVRQIADILCVKESCFKKRKSQDCRYRIYENKSKTGHFGIIYTSLAIPDYLETLKTIEYKAMPTYVFSYNNIISPDLKKHQGITAIPLPGPLLNLWNRGFGQ